MKKVIALAVIGMFLLIGLSGLTALATDTKTTKNEKQPATPSENLGTIMSSSFATVKCEFGDYQASQGGGLFFVRDLFISGQLSQPLIVRGETIRDAGQYVTLHVSLTTRQNFYHANCLVGLKGLYCLSVTVSY
jgi:hypothetical protein